MKQNSRRGKKIPSSFERRNGIKYATKGGDIVKYTYYPDDPMDTVPTPVGKLIASFLGITALFVVYIFIWGFVLK